MALKININHVVPVVFRNLEYGASAGTGYAYIIYQDIDSAKRS